MRYAQTLVNTIPLLKQCITLPDATDEDDLNRAETVSSLEIQTLGERAAT
jgi:hypothetical protein